MAKCDDWTKLRQYWKPGDVVWASAFRETSGKSGPLLRQRPQRGMLAAGRTEADHVNKLARMPGASATTFVPLTKRGKPSWSKAVWVGSRDFADTERESLELYNSAVQREIEYHRARIRELTSELVSTLDQTIDQKTDACAVEPIWRADFALSADDVVDAMDFAMYLKDDSMATVMTWDEFITFVEQGCINDHDGYGDLMIDGRVSQKTMLYIYDRRFIIDDTFMVPFDRIPELFEGREIKVVWFNK